MAQIKKRKRNINAFGEELYVPEIEIPEFDTDIGLATDDIDIEVEELHLFDYDRQDNNSDVRYMRPRPSRMPTACVRYDNADALAREIKFKSGGFGLKEEVEKWSVLAGLDFFLTRTRYGGSFFFFLFFFFFWGCRGNFFFVFFCFFLCHSTRHNTRHNTRHTPKIFIFIFP